jgi:hypothetical protein
LIGLRAEQNRVGPQLRWVDSPTWQRVTEIEVDVVARAVEALGLLAGLHDSAPLIVTVGSL